MKSANSWIRFPEDSVRFEFHGEFRLPRRLRDRTRQINENGRGNAIWRSRTNLPERTNNSRGRYQDGLREGSLCSCRSRFTDAIDLRRRHGSGPIRGSCQISVLDC